METKILEHECMTCGKVYWGEDKPQFCPNCNGSMVRVVETDKQSPVCTDELTELILEVQDAGIELGVANEWGMGIASAIKRAGEARAALREYVDALVSNGITAQIAENLEQIDTLQFAVDGYQLKLEEARAEIDALKEALVAMSNGKFAGLSTETQIMVARVVEQASEANNERM